MSNVIDWDQFRAVDMRVGTIMEVSDFPLARVPAYQLQIDFGPELGIRKSSAQITKRYMRDDLIGRQIVAVVNFPKKQIANFMSECLILGAAEGGDVVLLEPRSTVPNGTKIS